MNLYFEFYVVFHIQKIFIFLTAETKMIFDDRERLMREVKHGVNGRRQR